MVFPSVECCLTSILCFLEKAATKLGRSSVNKRWRQTTYWGSTCEEGESDDTRTVYCLTGIRFLCVCLTYICGIFVSVYTFEHFGGGILCRLGESSMFVRSFCIVLYMDESSKMTYEGIYYNKECYVLIHVLHFQYGRCSTVVVPYRSCTVDFA